MVKRFAIIVATAFMAVFLSMTPANAAEGCVIDVLGIKVCGTLVGQPLPEVVTVTVTPDPIRVPGPTVTIPGPTVTLPAPAAPQDTITVTEPPVRVPGPTQTVTVQVPGGTKTVTGPAAPTETRTVTEPSAPQSAGPQNPTTTVTETASPSPNVTETTSETASGQEPSDSGTLAPSPGPDFLSRDVDLGDGSVTVAETGLTLASLIGLAGLGLLLLYGGYILGYKNSEKADTQFMRALRDEILRR